MFLVARIVILSPLSPYLWILIGDMKTLREHLRDTDE